MSAPAIVEPPVLGAGEELAPGYRVVELISRGVALDDDQEVLPVFPLGGGNKKPECPCGEDPGGVRVIVEHRVIFHQNQPRWERPRGSKWTWRL